MAVHSRPLANILCKGTKKSAPKKDSVKMEIKKETSKKSK
jgi:hypothetical protein